MGADRATTSSESSVRPPEENRRARLTLALDARFHARLSLPAARTGTIIVVGMLCRNNLKMHAYKIPLTQELKPADHGNRESDPAILQRPYEVTVGQL